MTHAEWLACSEPGAMLDFLDAGLGRPGVPLTSDRKLRLALCACCRRVWGSLGPKGRAAVEAAERHADGALPAAGLRSAGMHAGAEAGSADRYTARNQACWAGAWLAQERLCHPDQVLRSAATAAGYAAVSYERALAEIDAAGAGGPQPLNAQWRAAYDAERAAQAALLREAFGDPWRLRRLRRLHRFNLRNLRNLRTGAPTALPHAWRAWEGGTVVRLAEAAYAERAFDRLPVLGDALEEAGCADDVILGHCRGAGPHARGCWVLDLLLGKG